MPTGYTHDLEEMNYDTHRWLTESVARAFGMCMSLRDTNKKLSEKEIEDHIKKDGLNSIKYHTDKLNEAKAKYAEYLNKDDKFWSDWHKKDYTEQFDAYIIDKKEFDEVKIPQYIKILKELEELLKKAEPKSTPYNIIKYGLDQWKLVKDEFNGKYLSEPISRSTEQFKKNMLSIYEREIAYHSKKEIEAQVNETKRLEAYRNFTKFLKETKE